MFFWLYHIGLRMSLVQIKMRWCSPRTLQTHVFVDVRMWITSCWIYICIYCIIYIVHIYINTIYIACVSVYIVPPCSTPRHVWFGERVPRPPRPRQSEWWARKTLIALVSFEADWSPSKGWNFIAFIAQPPTWWNMMEHHIKSSLQMHAVTHRGVKHVGG